MKKLILSMVVVCQSVNCMPNNVNKNVENISNVGRYSIDGSINGARQGFASEHHNLIDEEELQKIQEGLVVSIAKTINQVRSGNKSFNSGISSIRQYINSSISNLISDINDSHDTILDMTLRRIEVSQRKIEMEQENHERVLQKELKELRKASQKYQQRSELKTFLQRVYRNNVNNEFLLSYSVIEDNLQEVFESGDLVHIREKIAEWYEKVKVFESLYGRSDLGVTATEENLKNVRDWLKERLVVSLADLEREEYDKLKDLSKITLIQIPDIIQDYVDLAKKVPGLQERADKFKERFKHGLSCGFDYGPFIDFLQLILDETVKTKVIIGEAIPVPESDVRALVEQCNEFVRIMSGREV